MTTYRHSTEQQNGFRPKSVQLRLLGTFEMIIDQDVISLRHFSPHARALLCALALAPHQCLRADELSRLIWPHIEFVEPSRLNTLLARVRHMLAVVTGQRSMQGIWLTQKQGWVALYPDGGITVDVDEFINAYFIAHNSNVASCYYKALDLYHGDILGGNPYIDESHDLTRSWLQDAFIRLKIELADCLIVQCRIADAAFEQKDVIRRYPHRPEGYLALMHLLWRCGKPAEARRVFERARSTIDDDEYEVWHLYEAILAGSLPPADLVNAHGTQRGSLLEGDLGNAHARWNQFCASSTPTNLHRPTNPFIGCEVALSDLLQQLQTERFISIIGPGGCGKTRLALEAATMQGDRFPGGVWLIPLGGVASADLVPLLAQICAVPEERNRTQLECLIWHFQHTPTFLVLDSCEQLLAHSRSIISQLRANCPQLTILATSQCSLEIAGEVIFPLAPFAMPEQVPVFEVLREHEAIRLFVSIGAERQPGFQLNAANGPIIWSICARLEGLPLAIELAAGRMQTFSVGEIARRLEDHRQLEMLVRQDGENADRHVSLIAMIDGNYELLTHTARTVFERCAIFAGDWTLQRAKLVCSGAGLDQESLQRGMQELVQFNLLMVEGELFDQRFHLREPLRAYALRRLERSPDYALVAQQHSNWLIDFVDAAEAGMVGARQNEWFTLLEDVQADLRDALARASQPEQNGAVVGLRLAGGLTWFWYTRGRYSEGRRWLETFLNSPDHATLPPDLLARAYCGLGFMLFMQGDYEHATAHMVQSLSYPVEGPHAAIIRARAHSILGDMAFYRHDFAEALRYCRLSLDDAKQNGNGRIRAIALSNMGDVYAASQLIDVALHYYQESLAQAQELGDSRTIAMAHNNLGRIALLSGQEQAAMAMLEQSLSEFSALKDKRGTADTLVLLGSGARLRSEFARARQYFQEALQIVHASAYTLGILMCLEGYAHLLIAEGNDDEAVQLFAATSLRRQWQRLPVFPVDLPEHEQALAGLQQRVAPDRYEKLWQEGVKLGYWRAMEQMLAAAAHSATALPQVRDVLTPRQREIYHLINVGMTSKEIANKFHISPRTVEKHVQHIHDRSVEIAQRQQK